MKIKFIKQLTFFLKHNDNNITVLSSKFENQNFHSRFSVRKKIYLYKIHNRETNSHLFSKRVGLYLKKYL